MLPSVLISTTQPRLDPPPQHPRKSCWRWAWYVLVVAALLLVVRACTPGGLQSYVDAPTSSTD